MHKHNKKTHRNRIGMVLLMESFTLYIRYMMLVKNGAKNLL